VWTSLNGCSVHSAGLGCASGNVYRAAVEMQRVVDAQNRSTTVTYCDGAVYQCNDGISYGMQCSDGTVRCTWYDAAAAPPPSTLAQSHVVMQQNASPVNGWAAQVCFVDDDAVFAKMLIMQQATVGVWVAFVALVTFLLLCVWVSRQ
jgi:hypothetical protein